MFERSKSIEVAPRVWLQHEHLRGGGAHNFDQANVELARVYDVADKEEAFAYAFSIAAVLNRPINPAESLWKSYHRWRLRNGL